MKVIPLSGGKYVAIVSDEDYRRVKRYKWRVTHSAGKGRKKGAPYAKGVVKGKDTYLHRFIMGSPLGMQVDHINHCTLDCRRDNLEIVFAKENNRRRRNVVANNQQNCVKDKSKSNC